MNLLYGLVAALGWGSGDFLAGGAVKRIGPYRTLFYAQMPGIAALLLFLGVTGQGAVMRQATPALWGWAVGAALLNTGASIALYRAFATGMLSIAAPITASYAAVTTLLSLLSGERLSGPQALGIVSCLAGAALVAAVRAEEVPAGVEPDRDAARAVFWSVVAAFGFGVAFWLFGTRVTGPLSGAPSVLVSRISSVVLLAVIAPFLRWRLTPPDRGTLPRLVFVGLLDTVAFVANNIGLKGTEDALVSVAASQFCAVTVLLAWLLGKERLRPHQWLGIVLILGGVAALGWK